MKKALSFLTFLLGGVFAFAGEITFSSGGSFDITSRTSLGMNLDHPYQYGIEQDLTEFKLRIDLVPYQKLSNEVNSSDAVGFVNLTFFDLGIELSPNHTPGSASSGYNDPAALESNRFQTGEFIAGIAKGNWIFQLNAGGNEPFASPWNNGIQFVNDRIGFTWAFLQSMVDVERKVKISELSPEDDLVAQYKQDNLDLVDPSTNPTDSFGMDKGSAVALTYNKEEAYGFNIKFATQYGYHQETLGPANRNGLGAGFDLALDPAYTRGFRVYGSLAGTWDYGADADPDPLMGGIQIAPVIPLSEDISLEPYVATDLGTTFNQKGDISPLRYEAAVGITMRWPGEGGWYTDYILDADGRVFPGMSVAYKVYGDATDNVTELRHDAKFTLFEPRGDEGVFYGLGSEIIVDVNDITTEYRAIMATVYLDYTKTGVLNGPGSLIPWTAVCFDNVPGTVSGRVNGLKLDLGTKLDGAIRNTVFGIAWRSGDLLQTNSVARFGVVKTTVEIKY